MSGKSFRRARITGALTCRSELHLGDGDEELLSDRQHASKEEGGYNTICRGSGGSPYLPGSSLRGAVLSDVDKTTDGFRRLFGYSSDDPTDADKRKASRVRFRDAYLDKAATQDALPDRRNLPHWDESRMSFVRHGIKLDPTTGSVESGHLFRHELVPKSSVFTWAVEIDDPRQEELEWLLGLLRRFDGTPWSTLGRGRSKGLGRICYAGTTVEVQTNDAYEQWLETDGTRAPPFATLPKYPATQPAPTGTRPSLTLGVQPRSPVLVNEPAMISEAKGAPKLEFSRTTDGRALVPGASLKGLVRAHASRVLATIAHQCYQVSAHKAGTCVAPLVEALFGGERSRAVIWFSDLLSNEPALPHRQFFIAVDRFTHEVKKANTDEVKNGKKGGALFNVNAARSGEMSFECYLDHQRLPQGDWWKGLLLLVARDAMECQLAIGWGKGKGYGALQLRIAGSGDWSTLLQTLRADGNAPQTWIGALHERVKALAVTADAA